MLYKLKLRGSFAGPMGVYERGDEIEADEKQARRFIALGLAQLVEGQPPLPKAKAGEDEEARREKVETASITIGPDGLETACVVRPVRKRPPGTPFKLPPIKTAAGVLANDED